jgi:hypothetical protein
MLFALLSVVVPVDDPNKARSEFVNTCTPDQVLAPFKRGMAAPLVPMAASPKLVRAVAGLAKSDRLFAADSAPRLLMVGKEALSA